MDKRLDRVAKLQQSRLVIQACQHSDLSCVRTYLVYSSDPLYNNEKTKSTTPVPTACNPETPR
eukprot:650065-Amorphochlora_amoeboformis.AAC.1